jgi:hypothetical protein
MLLLRFEETVLQLEVEIPDHASEYQTHLGPSIAIDLSEKAHRLVGKNLPHFDANTIPRSDRERLDDISSI